MEPTLILALESTCDETAAAVVVDGKRVLSNVVASQIGLHARFKGVVPEIASRAHVQKINATIAEALAEAGVTGQDLSAIAVTNRPGLIGCLIVSVTAAKALSWAWQKPLIAVDHIQAHALSAGIEHEVKFPAIALVVSGGHTALYHVRDPRQIERLGATIDDAVGEAYDKVAATLGLGYPGGPIIDRMTCSPNGRSRESGDREIGGSGDLKKEVVGLSQSPDHQIARSPDHKNGHRQTHNSKLKTQSSPRFPRTLLGADSLDFSFSGLKTAVLYHVHGPSKFEGGLEKLTPVDIAGIATEFQYAVVEVLVEKMRRAAKCCQPKSLLLGGGVAANRGLRAGMKLLSERLGVPLYLPSPQFCTDNAAMTAALAYHHFMAGHFAALDLEAYASGSIQAG